MATRKAAKKSVVRKASTRKAAKGSGKAAATKKVVKPTKKAAKTTTRALPAAKKSGPARTAKTVSPSPVLPTIVRRPRGAALTAAPTPAARPDGVSERRWNRKLVLDALQKETGVDGGSSEQRARIVAFRNDPGGASLDDFVFVGALALKNWYVDPDKPGASERPSLWITLTGLMGKPGAANPDNWGPTTSVSQLQTIVEIAQ